MINELNHRVKNTLATVQALARQTFAKSQGSTDAAAAVEKMSDGTCETSPSPIDRIV